MCPLKDIERWNRSSANISTSPLESNWKANEKQRLPEPHLTVPSLASAGMVVMASGSPKPSAALTNWIKLHWWKTSCIPLWTPRSAGLGRNSRLIIPVLWSWGRARRGWAEVGAGGRDEHGLGTQGAAASAASRWHISDSYLSPSMPRGNELWFKPLEVFLLGLTLTAFFYFILSPRFQVQLQTQKCVSPLSAEKGFMCSADYCMSLFSTESKL